MRTLTIETASVVCFEGSKVHKGHTQQVQRSSNAVVPCLAVDVSSGREQERQVRKRPRAASRGRVASGACVEGRTPVEDVTGNPPALRTGIILTVEHTRPYFCPSTSHHLRKRSSQLVLTVE
jgi:hypothetical protein